MNYNLLIHPVGETLITPHIINTGWTQEPQDSPIALFNNFLQLDSWGVIHGQESSFYNRIQTDVINISELHVLIPRTERYLLRFKGALIDPRTKCVILVEKSGVSQIIKELRGTDEGDSVTYSVSMPLSFGDKVVLHIREDPFNDYAYSQTKVMGASFTVQSLDNEEVLGLIGDYSPMDIDQSQDVAITYKALNIAELKQRWSGSSNQIKLPRTATNERLLGFPASPLRSIDFIPTNTFIRCILEIDGVQVCDSSSRLLVSRVTKDWFHVEILHGTFDLFNNISLKMLNEIEGVSFQPLRRDAASIAAAHNAMVGGEIQNAVIAVMDWNAEDNPEANLKFEFPQTGALFKINTLTLVPFVKLKALLGAIIGGEGYRVKTGVDTHQNYYNAAISLSGRTLHPLGEAASGWVQNGSSSTSSGFLQLEQTGSLVGSASYDLGGARLIVTPGYDGVVKIKIKGKLFQPARMSVEKLSPGASLLWTSPQYVDYQFSDSDTIEVYLFSHESIRMQISTYGGGEGSASDVSFMVESQEIGLEMPNTLFPIIENLRSDWTQRDLVQAISIMYGLIPQADNINKMLNLYGIDDVYENRNIARDWSGKVFKNTGEVELHNRELGQLNTIQYEELEESAFNEAGESRQIKVTDKYGFKIDDTTLQREVELFTIPFSPSTRDEGLMFMKARSLRGGDLQNDDEQPIRVGMLERRPFDFRFGDGKVAEWTSEEQLSSAICIMFDKVNSKELINTKYDGFAKMLSKSGIITEMMWLTPADVANFDHSIPIYLEKHGSFFYVSSIINYRSDKPTKVELMRL